MRYAQTDSFHKPGGVHPTGAHIMRLRSTHGLGETGIRRPFMQGSSIDSGISL